MIAANKRSMTFFFFEQDDTVDEDELWLRQYVLGNEWKREDDALPSYKEIIGVAR